MLFLFMVHFLFFEGSAMLAMISRTAQDTASKMAKDT